MTSKPNQLRRRFRVLQRVPLFSHSSLCFNALTIQRSYLSTGSDMHNVLDAKSTALLQINCCGKPNGTTTHCFTIQLPSGGPGVVEYLERIGIF